VPWLSALMVERPSTDWEVVGSIPASCIFSHCYKREELLRGWSWCEIAFTTQDSVGLTSGT
jgi:hypothetical protein